MKNKLYKYLFCLLLITGYRLPFAFLRAQDIHFAQLSETPLVINPALTGLYDGYYRGIINYRSQWRAMGKPYSTFMFTADAPLEMKKKKGGYIGLGANIFTDKAGDASFGSMQANLLVSAILPTNKNGKLSMGLQFGYAQRTWDLGGIQWPNQYNGNNYDPNISSNETLNRKFSYFDMGLGGNFETMTSKQTIDGKNITKFDIGAAFFHPTSPLQKFNSGTSEHLYGKIVVNSSLRYDIDGTVMGIVPSLIFMNQGPATELNLGMLLRYKISQGTKITAFYNEQAISAGLHYRWKDAISPQVFFEMSDFGIGLSYDINISTYTQNLRSTSALELSIKYAGMKGAARKKVI